MCCLAAMYAECVWFAPEADLNVCCYDGAISIGQQHTILHHHVVIPRELRCASAAASVTACDLLASVSSKGILMIPASNWL